MRVSFRASFLGLEFCPTFLCLATLMPDVNESSCFTLFFNPMPTLVLGFLCLKKLMPALVLVDFF